MNALIKFSRNNLGHCPRCMRIAGLYMMGAWVFAGSVWMFLGPQIAGLALAVAGIFTALWALHVFMFSARSAARRKQCDADKGVADPHRRRVAVQFLKTAALAAVGTTFATSAMAQYNCAGYDYLTDNRGYGSCGQFCRDTDGNTWNCPNTTRPIFMNDGGCTCCEFPECS